MPLIARAAFNPSAVSLLKAMNQIAIPISIIATSTPEDIPLSWNLLAVTARLGIPTAIR